MSYDALVVGGGISGMESAITLGDMGYRVLVVEKQASIGGTMILLSKVFPTLDCASCIATPKMAATVHHPNVTVRTLAEVEAIEPTEDGRFQTRIRSRARFIDEALCTGCSLCETACTVAVPDQFNAGLIGRRAAYIPFPQAVPKKAVIERAGTSPCTAGCPAGIKAHGYVALVRSGRYESAYELVLEATPLVGSLGRTCYAPCETACTRNQLDGPVAIRRLKRFVADRHLAPEPASPPAPDPGGGRVAVIGAGPAGLTCAWQLARSGHRVTIFEASSEPGGMLRWGIPDYRLPPAVVAADVANVTRLGVEIRTGVRIDDPVALRDRGYDAVCIATGTPVAAALPVAGAELDGVTDALTFLRQAKLDAAPDLVGRSVAVVGGGNVAIDAARSARRLGAARVRVVSLERRDAMPAYPWEVDDAESEGVELHGGWGIAGFVGDRRVLAVAPRRGTEVVDATGRFAPRYDDQVTRQVDADLVVVAVGMTRDDSPLAQLVPTEPQVAPLADPQTLATAVPGLFAAGDVVTGPSMITTAVGQGRRAAAMIDSLLRGRPADAAAFDRQLPAVDPAEVLGRQRRHTERPALAARAIDPAPLGFAELEPPMSEAEALQATGRCLDCGVCSECHACIEACPADAIDLGQADEVESMTVGTVVLATGFRLFAADHKPQYGYGRFANVVTGMEMDRLLAPTRPYDTLLRPGDGRVPERIAYILCTGSRDQQVGNPLCSRICCMYSIKQNQLLMGALPLADVTVFTVDVRAAGKGYEEFYVQAEAMGATFVRGRVAQIEETATGDLLCHYEDLEGGGARQAEFDLVVLAVGVLPNPDAHRLFPDGQLRLDAQAFVDEVDRDLDPGRTSVPGVFVAGTAAGAKDIPEAILHAGSAAAQAAAHLERIGPDR